MASFDSGKFGHHRFGIPETNISTAEKEWDNDGIEFGTHSNTRKLMSALLSEADRIDGDLASIHDAQHIDTAEGDNLEQLGKLVQIHRKSGESDDKYRARIKLKFRVGNIGTTYDEFAEFTGVMLETDARNVEFSYNFGSDPATVNVAADGDLYNSTSLTSEEIADFLEEAVPAGHAVKATEKGTFRLKSDGDTDDASKGLTSDSVDTGGTLASDLV